MRSRSFTLRTIILIRNLKYNSRNLTAAGTLVQSYRELQLIGNQQTIRFRFVVFPCVISVGIGFLSLGPVILIRQYDEILFSPTVQLTVVLTIDAILIIVVFTRIASRIYEKSRTLVRSQYRMTRHFRSNKIFRKEVESMQELKAYAGDGYIDRSFTFRAMCG
jgi:uncharacterized membrane protein